MEVIMRKATLFDVVFIDFFECIIQRKHMQNLQKKKRCQVYYVKMGPFRNVF